MMIKRNVNARAEHGDDDNDHLLSDVNQSI